MTKNLFSKWCSSLILFLGWLGYCSVSQATVKGLKTRLSKIQQEIQQAHESLDWLDLEEQNHNNEKKSSILAKIAALERRKSEIQGDLRKLRPTLAIKLDQLSAYSRAHSCSGAHDTCEDAESQATEVSVSQHPVLPSGSGFDLDQKEFQQIKEFINKKIGDLKKTQTYLQCVLDSLLKVSQPGGTRSRLITLCGPDLRFQIYFEKNGQKIVEFVDLEIGKGASKTVYFAFLLEPGQPIKTHLLAGMQAENLGRFELENLKKIAALRPEWELAHLEVDPSGQTAHFFQPLFEGGSLETLLDRQPEPRSFDKVLNAYGLPVLKDLYQLHCHGFLHLDVKPQNILIRENSVHLSDFSTVRTRDQLVQAPGLLGTPSYMAPEAIEEQYSPKADVWSLGMTLWMIAHRGLGSHCQIERFVDLLRIYEIKNYHDLYRNCGISCPTWRSKGENLVCQMLHPNVKKRPSVEELLLELKEQPQPYPDCTTRKKF